MKKIAFDESEGVLVFRSRDPAGNLREARVNPEDLLDPPESFTRRISTLPEPTCPLSSAACAESLEFPDDALAAVEVCLAGGEGAREVLRSRLSRLASDDRMFTTAHPRFASCIFLAWSLLQLDPDSTDAARTLVRLFAHPIPQIRDRAIASASSVYQRELETEAMLYLRRGLVATLTADASAFVAAAPALFQIGGCSGAVVARCEELLGSAEEAERQNCIILLDVQLDNKLAMRLLARHIEREPSPQLALDVAMRLGSLIADSKRDALIEACLADESPVVRLAAVKSLDRVSADCARRHSEQALVDEPDPRLRALLLDAPSKPRKLELVP